MGLLDIFSKPKPASTGPLEIPAGTFTVDKDGEVLSTTLPASFPADCIARITKPILAAFAGAKAAHIPLTEIVVSYSALKITAKEMRGGAMVFLTPHGPQRQL